MFFCSFEKEFPGWLLIRIVFQIFDIHIQAIFLCDQIGCKMNLFTTTKDSITIGIISCEDIFDFGIGITTSFQRTSPFFKLDFQWKENSVNEKIFFIVLTSTIPSLLISALFKASWMSMTRWNEEEELDGRDMNKIDLHHVWHSVDRALFHRIFWNNLPVRIQIFVYSCHSSLRNRYH